jgi:hypothetical protein
MASQEEHLNPSKHTLELDLMQAANLNHGTYMMNHLPSTNCRLNMVDSSPSTPIRRAPGGTAARAFLRPNWWSRITVAVVVLIGCALVKVVPAAAQNIPTGTIELSGGSVAAGIGYTWGRGTLVFEGKKYRLKVNGISILRARDADMPRNRRRVLLGG